MKRAVAIFIVFAILAQLSGKLAVFLSYTANQQYISNNLCVNKSKPSLHCNGKCFLARQLKKDKENSATSSLKEKLEVLASGSPAGCTFRLTALAFVFPSPVNEYSYFSVNDIFHPP